VVKNVAGYDLPRLFVGSFGTLGVIVEASFKLAALPAVQATVRARPAGLQAAWQMAEGLRARNLPLRALEIGDTGEGLVMLVDVSSRPAVVSRLVREVGEAAGSPVDVLEAEDHASAWRDWSEAGLNGEGTMVVRAVALPAAVPALVEAASRHEGARFQARPGTGVVRVVFPAANAGDVRLTREAAHRAGGFAIIEHGPAELRRSLSTWDGRTALGPAARLRAAFDPKRTLNPGRFFDGEP
jgi:glycolate oxidase FAD binding subunit